MVRKRNNYNLDESRVIAFLDVDCFSVQVMRRLDPRLKGKPFATRRNPKSRMDSVSYEANGVIKNMSESEAKQHCPHIQIVTKSEVNGFNEKQESVSQQFFDVIRKFCGNDIIIEWMSLDDLYLDLTDACDQYVREQRYYDNKTLKELNVVVEGARGQYPFYHNRSLYHQNWAEAAVIMDDLCVEIFRQTGLKCSVGISFNKLLAKIGCKLNKPQNITIIPSKPGIARVFEQWLLQRCDGYGSIFGANVVQRLEISTLKELRRFRRKYLINVFGNSRGALLWDVCRGIDRRLVRYKPDSDTKSVSHKWGSDIECKDPIVCNDLEKLCQKFANKLNQDLKRNQRIAQKLKIEVYAKSRTFSSTIDLNVNNNYRSKHIYQTILGQHFPIISERVPQFISGFKLNAIKFKSISNFNINDLTQKMSGMCLSVIESNDSFDKNNSKYIN